MSSEEDYMNDGEGDSAYDLGDDSTSDPDDNIMIIGRREEVRRFLMEMLAETHDVKIEPEPVDKHDPFDPMWRAITPAIVKAGLPPAQTLPPAPRPEPPTPAPPPPKQVRGRTLPVEPADGNVHCSHFTLVHGASGGPGEGGCFAVGCTEGYALPMRFGVAGWEACKEPTRLEREGECYHFRDSDGSERSVRYRNGTWVACK